MASTGAANNDVVIQPGTSSVQNSHEAAGCEAKKHSVDPGPDDEKLNDDERERFYWRSRYEDPKARRQIYFESAYVIAVLVAALAGIFLVWHGAVLAALTDNCVECQPQTLKRYGYFFFAGVLGGALYGLKYLYKVVARGWWNQDRVIWRISSPLLSGGLAFAVGALADAGMFGFSTGSNPGAASVALGFIVGYFADSASRKMQELAETLFGHPSGPKPTNRQ